jgi:hypothetical protein
VHRKHALACLAACMAVALALCAAVAPAHAYVASSGGVWLLDNGADDLENASADWKFWVYVPLTVGLDGDYWNFTAYGELLNNSGSASAGTYKVYVSIDDGATNTTKYGSITVSLTSIVYGNVSYDSTAITAFVANESGTITLQLKNATDVVLDTYVAAIGIYESGAAGSVMGWMPSLVGFMMFVTGMGIVYKAMGYKKGKGK